MSNAVRRLSLAALAVLPLALAACELEPDPVSAEEASAPPAAGPELTPGAPAAETNAADTTVTWTVEPAGCGAVTATGRFTAPSTARTCTVRATANGDTTKSSAATVAAVVQPGAVVLHGISIPATHPRIWFDPARLAAARAWYTTHPFTPSQWAGLGWASYALRGLLNNEPAQCQTAVDWAVGFNPTASGPIYDNLRWHGQSVALIWDWCYSTFTPAQRATMLANWNTWFTLNKDYSWAAPGGISGSRSGPFGNYYWGVIRGDLLWALASADENQAAAETFLEDALVVRYANEFIPMSTSVNRGGVGTDSSHYGPYTRHYASVGFETARLLGRDLWAETPWWLESVYATIYQTAPAQSTQRHGGVDEASWDYFPFGDEEFWNTTSSNGGNQARLDVLGDFMTIAASRWASSNTGRYASQWLSTVAPGVNNHVAAVAGSRPAGLSFSTLPLDYFAAGPAYWYGHSHADWAAGTAFAMNLGFGTVLGHVHDDYGSWQLWRGGRWIARETTEYAQNIVGYGGTGSAGVVSPVAHNVLLVDGVGPSYGRAWRGAPPTTRRLESRPGYAFASADLGQTYPSNVASAVRDFVFVRDLEALVILDRVQADTATRTRTFLAHCENAWTAVDANDRVCTTGAQSLGLTTLVPAAPAYRTVAEGGSFGQNRLEVDHAPGTAQSYMLHVVHARGSGAAALTPTVAETDTTFTVTLDATHRVVFQKGMASSGGSVTVGASTTSLRADVQGLTVTENGPAWQ